MIFLAAVSELIYVRVGPEGRAASRRLDRHGQSEQTARNTVRLIMCLLICTVFSQDQTESRINVCADRYVFVPQINLPINYTPCLMKLEKVQS